MEVFRKHGNVKERSTGIVARRAQNAAMGMIVRMRRRRLVAAVRIAISAGRGDAGAEPRMGETTVRGNRED